MEAEFNYPYEHVYINCLEAAHQLHFSIVKENISTGIISYKIPASFLSWGETFVIKIVKIDALNTKVEIESSSWQFIDWGKNKQNVAVYFATLNTLLK